MIWLSLYLVAGIVFNAITNTASVPTNSFAKFTQSSMFIVQMVTPLLWPLMLAVAFAIYLKENK